jgi:hypothetical protein
VRRISAIRSNREVELEKRREELLDIRWARWRNQMITTVSLMLVVALCVTGDSADVVRALRTLIGL